MQKVLFDAGKGDKRRLIDVKKVAYLKAVRFKMPFLQYMHSQGVIQQVLLLRETKQDV